MKSKVTRMKDRLSLNGALVGGVACAVLRAAFTYYNVLHAEATDDIARGVLGVFAFLPSAGIGLLCGSIAGATGRVWLGALLGALLSVGIFGLFVLPFAFCFSFVEPEKWLAEFTWVYFAQKGTAGAICSIRVHPWRALLKGGAYAGNGRRGRDGWSAPWRHVRPAFANNAPESPLFPTNVFTMPRSHYWFAKSNLTEHWPDREVG